MGQPQRALPQVPRPPFEDFDVDSPAPDEISLFDLWNALIRQRWVIAVVAAVVTAGSVGAVSWLPDAYAYRTAIEIGSFVTTGPEVEERRFVEPPAIVEHKLLEAYVPLVRSQLADELDGRAPPIHVGTKEDSAVFVLSSEAPPEQAATVRTAHQKVAALLVDDHGRATDTVLEEQLTRLEGKRAELAHLTSETVRGVHMQSLERRHEAARQQLARMDDELRVAKLELDSAISGIQGSLTAAAGELKVLGSRLERLADRESLVKEQVASTRALLEDLRTARSGAVTEAAAGAGAVAVLMVGSEIAATERRLWDREQELRVDLAERRADLEQEIAVTATRRENLQAELAELEARRAKLTADHRRSVAAQEAEVRQLGLEVAKGRQDHALERTRLEGAIKSLETARDDVRETRTLYLAARSPEAAGPGVAVAGALGSVLGLMLGVFAAFLVEFARRARHYRTAA